MIKYPLIFIIVIVLTISGFIFYQQYSDDQILQKKQEQYKVTFDKELLHSNLYSPHNVKSQNTSTNAANLTWEFQDKELIIDEDHAPEYAKVSGFRIYRNNWWLADVSANTMYYTDKPLSPDHEYKYEIAVLTFDNKIEGKKSAALSVTTKQSSLAPISQVDLSSITTYLAEGDSITEGQRATKGNGWVDQFSTYLATKNKNVKTFNKGVSGSTTQHIEGRLQEEINLINPDFVTIGAGLNDITAASNYLGNYSMSQYRNSMEKIINITKSPKRAIVLLNIYFTNCCDNPDATREKTIEWNRVLKDLASAHNILVIDVYKAMQENGGNTLLDNPLHPNQTGHNLISQELIKKLTKNNSIR